MAFDGITVAGIVKELKDSIEGGRISKIAQPEPDELLLTIKGPKANRRLMISASASLPLIYLTDKNKISPKTAPNFCMLLRKHIGNGRITAINQPGLERVIELDIEHYNEMGDLCKKKLIIEIMGKHSNIIFCNEEGMIIDSIKHVSAQMSSVREVLPGRDYFLPQTQEKFDPFLIEETEFISGPCQKPMKTSKAIYTSLTGISPVAAEEICFRASIDSDKPANTLEEPEVLHLYGTFRRFIEDVRSGSFTPSIVYDGQVPVEFSAVPLLQYQDLTTREFDSISEVLQVYYASKSQITRIRQKSSDLRRIVQTAHERSAKKYDLQTRQLKDTEKREKFKIYGELLHTYGYEAEEGAKSLKTTNYYTGEPITIPLDPDLTAMENAKKYFDKYNKLKRTYEATTKLLEETKEEMEHLDSIRTALDMAREEEDLTQIKAELTDYGYIRKKHSGKRTKITAKPFHYISSDGYHIYVGKNNFQNEELTFQFATGNDWWFHAKGMAGSHVIVKDGSEDMPDRVFEEAGRLAAYYSKGRGGDKVEIDYTQKKNVKKPARGKPGFVVYYTNYSLVIDSDISGLKESE